MARLRGQTPMTHMRKTLWQKLTEPRSDNEDEKIREHMTRVILILTLSATLVFSVLITAGWLAGFYDSLPAVILAGMDLALGAGWWLVNRGRLRLAGMLPPIVFYLLALYGTYTAGLTATTVLLYPLAILLTAMLQGERAQWGMLSISVITHLAVGIWRSPEIKDSLVPPALTVSGALIGVSLLQWFFASQLQRALASTRAYAAVMKEYRDHLEELVEARTAALNKINEALQNEIAERRQTQEALKKAHDELEIRVQERTAELSIMLDAARAASSTLELEHLLKVIAKQMVTAIGATSSTIYRYENDQAAVIVWEEWRRDGFQSDMPPGTALSLTELPTLRAVLEDRKVRALHADDPDLSPAEKDHLSRSGVGGLVFLPLATRDRALGLVALGVKDSTRQLTLSERRLCGALADQAAVTIENAHLHTEIKLRSERLTALHNIDMAITASLDLKFILNVLLEQVTSQLKVDAAVVLLNQNNHHLKYAAGRGFHATAIERRKFRFGEGHAGKAALKRHLVTLPNLNDEPDGMTDIALLNEERFVAYVAIPLISRGEVMGVLEIFHRAPIKPDPGWVSFLETLAGQAAIAIYNTNRLDILEQSKGELEAALLASLEAWAQALDERCDRCGHSQRVVDLTLQLASASGMAPDKMAHIARGALLHDIGMIAVPEDILRKPGPLELQERAIVENHPLYAQRLLSEIPYLAPAAVIPYCHHERWDGSGYPRGLKGEEIPLEARIFAVVDVWDALTSDRLYRQAWPETRALAYIQEQAGRAFDPQVVTQFISLMKQQHLQLPGAPISQTQSRTH